MTFNKHHRQSGSVLIISLILLLIIAVVFTNSITSTTHTQRVAANFQNKNESFHAAQTEIDTQLHQVLSGNLSALNAALNEPDGEADLNSLPLFTNSSTLDTDVKIRHVSPITLTSQQSLNADESIQVVQPQRFELFAKGSVVNHNNIRTEIRQGIEIK